MRSGKSVSVCQKIVLPPSVESTELHSITNQKTKFVSLEVSCYVACRRLACLCLLHKLCKVS